MTDRPDGPAGRQRWEMGLGWAALVCFVAAVGMALLEHIPFGFAFLITGAVLSLGALALELRRRASVKQATKQGEARVFPATGTFGAPRSSQTHTRMM